MTNQHRIWLVTGASKGLGLVLVQQLLAGGYRVAATSRSAADLRQKLGEPSAQFLPLEVDLASEASVIAGVRAAHAHFGGLDVVVNNAGYGQLGTVEELSDAEARQNFDTNVFGALNVLRAAIPVLREQRRGHVFNISSVGGFTGNFPGWGIYCATKFALAGLTEALHAELSPFGIGVTLVYPGYFRTEFLTAGSRRGPAAPIAAYANARASEALHANEIDGKQPGDPAKAAAAMITVATMPDAPLHLFLGSDAVTMAAAKQAAVQRDLATHDALSRSTDF